MTVIVDTGKVDGMGTSEQSQIRIEDLSRDVATVSIAVHCDRGFIQGALDTLVAHRD